MIIFSQSTAVLHKYLNDERKLRCLLQFFPEVAQNPLRIPSVFYVQRNPSVFQVCGRPDKADSNQPRRNADKNRDGGEYKSAKQGNRCERVNATDLAKLRDKHLSEAG